VAAAVICAACGAKVRADRPKCLRCREPLVARKDAPPPRPIAWAAVPWTTVGIVAGCVALGGVGVMFTGGSSQATEPVAAVVRQASPAGAPAVRATGGVAAAATSIGTPDPSAVAVSGLLAGQKAYDSGNMAVAAERLQAAVDANPNDHRALNDLAQVLVRAGRAQEAMAYLDKAVQLAPDSWTYQFNRARAYAQLQKWDQAIQGYRAAAQLFPDDYATQYNLAKALQASGSVNDALAGYEKAIKLAPGQPDFQLSYGLALEAARRPQDAVAAYKRYLELEPESTEAEKVKAHLAELQPTASSKGTE
jgi:tetratricopeptide (TPR) repeat protein